MIRNYIESDIDDIINIWLEASIQSHDFIDTSYWHSKIQDMRNIYIPASKSFVYTEGGATTAFVSLVDNYIAAIFVKPSQQRKGIGKLLIDFIKSQYANLTLKVYSKNVGAVKFYLANGFNIICEQIDTDTNELEKGMSYNLYTEKEKAKNGELYDANYDKELVAERQTCKDLCFEYNNTLPSLANKRTDILKTILGKTKKNFFIEQPFYCDYGYNISIGENFFANFNCTILDGATVEFGDNVFIGPGCGFYTACHPLDVETRNKGLETAKRIKVGNNVWIGAQVVILPGITIGDNSVIGAGSVVSKDIPSNVVAVGNPCKVIKNVNNDKTK